MLFNSVAYLIFFPIVCLCYFILPHRYRWVLLLAASYFFYMFWEPIYIIIILASTIIDYWCGIKMNSLRSKKARKPFLYLSLISNLGILISFKYSNFLIEQFNTVFTLLNISYVAPALEFLLPMGISFYTFQTMSYSIDVYHGRIKAEKHFGIFALFVTFFPQLVAGPIERAGHLLNQFKEKHYFSYENTVWGLNKILYGLFKKVVVADRISLYVDQVYGNVEGHSPFTLIVATVFFSIQIYCDFSGYSDIAIGSARIMGFDLMENFRRPYLSRTISEFWKRWHISLSTWFRDYLYIPLGGNRVVKWKWYYNLLITFLVSGFWHGANWTFIIWGGLHGLYLIVGTFLPELTDKLKISKKNHLVKLLDIGVVYLLVCFAWVFFRANSLDDAFHVINSCTKLGEAGLNISDLLNVNGAYSFLMSLGAMILLLISYLLPYNLNLKYPKVFAVFCIIIIISLGVNGEQFIYFQF